MVTDTNSEKQDLERKITISNDLCKSIEKFQINDESGEITRIHNQSKKFLDSFANPKNGLKEQWYERMFLFDN